MFVYAASEGLVQNRVDGGTVMMRRGDVWWADDPFVLSRPELFSATPLTVQSTRGRQHPEPTPLGVPELAEPAHRGRPRKLA